MTSIKILIIGICTAILVFTLSTAPSQAAERVKKQSECSKQFDQCLIKCKEDYGDQTARHAACVPVCSGKFAACDAGVAYEKAKPWIEDQAKKSKEFFDDLIEKYGTKESPEDPQKKTKKNSI